MTGLAMLALVAFFLWLVRGQGSGRPRGRSVDGETAIDRGALVQAEEELAEDPRPRSLGDRAHEDDDDDWGPGTGR